MTGSETVPSLFGSQEDKHSRWIPTALQSRSADPLCSVLGILSHHLDDKAGNMGSRQRRTPLWNTPAVPPLPQEPKKTPAVRGVCPFTVRQSSFLWAAQCSRLCNSGEQQTSEGSSFRQGECSWELSPPQLGFEKPTIIKQPHEAFKKLFLRS